MALRPLSAMLLAFTWIRLRLLTQLTIRTTVTELTSFEENSGALGVMSLLLVM